MEFGKYIRGPLLLFAATGLVSTGCSSSEAFVDYEDIQGPVSDDAAVGGSPAAGDVSTVSYPATGAADPVEPQQDTDVTRIADAGPTQPATLPPGGSDVPPSDEPPVTDEAGSSSADTAENPVDSKVNGTTDVAAAGDPQNSATESTEPREIKLLVPEKRFRTEGDSDSLRVTYDDIDLLQVLNMQPVPVNAVDHFPGWLSDLDGKRIRLRGFMFPTFVATGLTRFALARDNGICCFVKQPKIYDMIDVTMAEGETTDYIDNKPFDVEGILRIDPDGDDTELFQLYRIEEAVVLK